MQTVAGKYCNTEVQVRKFGYKWTISNFNIIQNQMSPVSSPTFTSDAISSTRSVWQLSANPQGNDEYSKNYLSLYLTLVSCKTSEVQAIFQFLIINANGEKTYTRGSNSVLYRIAKEESLGFRSFIKRDYLLNEGNALLPEDKLTIFCEISVLADNIRNVCRPSNKQCNVPECRLSEDLGALLDNERVTDVTLVVDGKEFQAHKAILVGKYLMTTHFGKI